MKKEKQIMKLFHDWFYANINKNPMIHLGFEPSYVCPSDVYHWLDAQTKEGFADCDAVEKSLLNIGSTDTGGELFLWDYENRNEPAPVVFLGDSGEYDVIASSLNDFICLLAQGQMWYSQYDDASIKWDKVTKNDILDCFLGENTKKPIETYANLGTDFLNQFNDLIELKTVEQCFENRKNAKDFREYLDIWLAEQSILEGNFRTLEEVEDSTVILFLGKK